MDNASPDEGKLIIKALRERLYGNRAKEIEKSDKEELYWKNVELEKDNAKLKSRIEVLEKTLKEWSKGNWVDFPKLIVDQKERSFKFTSEEVTKTAKFPRETNEYLLLKYFINKPLIPHSVQILKDELKQPRAQANHLSKRRVLDTVTILRNKLGKDILFDFADGSYALFADIEYIK